jgi:hypothetical protein
MEKDLQNCIDTLQILLAVELLEYHDKNLLSGDNKTRSEYLQSELARLLRNMQRMKDNITPVAP